MRCRGRKLFCLEPLKNCHFSTKYTDLTFESSVTHIHEQNCWTIDNIRSYPYTNRQPTGLIITVEADDQLKRVLKNLKIENVVDKYLLILLMPLRNPLKTVSKIMRPLLNVTLNFEIIAPDPTNATYYMVYSWVQT